MSFQHWRSNNGIMLILGFVLAGIMGILLGMLGGGGSILTVPILVYVLGVADDDAPSYSLFVVGVAAAIGAVQYVRLKQFSLKVSLVYGIPSMLAVYFNQAFVRNWIPESFPLLGMQVGRGTLFMILFAIMMLLAAWSMIRKKSRQTPDNFDVGSAELKLPKIAAIGLVEGLLTGLVGAGGGFIIVPALVAIAKMPIKKAVGTSLLVMAVKSLIGFGGALQHIDVDWALLLPFTGIAAIGIVFGAMLAKKVPAGKLKLFFGWFILAMGTFIVVKTILDSQG
ncbi:MAG TPA: sulfite exporter TauE/SafE family protein [Bacteroidia bacterium]|nr:sulfite exporter TauE/SafE family protein [Bacteroidia bacterium]